MARQAGNHRMLSLFAALLVLLTSGEDSRTSGGEIADLHQKWIRPKEGDYRKQQEKFESLEKPTHGVTEICLERTACNGTCPIYTVIIKSDGTLRYVGEEHVARKGKHVGQISPYQFNRLAEYVVESGYLNLDANYDLPQVADFPETYTMAIVGGKRKLVRNYGDLGPVKLWALQQSIDSLLTEADWDGEKSNTSDTEKAPESKP